MFTILTWYSLDLKGNMKVRLCCMLRTVSCNNVTTVLEGRTKNMEATNTDLNDEDEVDIRQLGFRFPSPHVKEEVLVVCLPLWLY